LLEELKDAADVIPPQAQEMAWTCETASYAQHERTPEMVERVRAFAQNYPNSDFLQKLVEPVRDVQSRKIDDYFKAGDVYGAVKFFEKTRSYLFPEVSEQLANRLFSAYAEINQAERAKEFLETFAKSRMNELGLLQLAAVLVELVDTEQDKVALQRRNKNLALELEKMNMLLPLENRVRLYLHRIINHQGGIDHYPWILALGLKWMENDVSTACDIVYPMLQKIQSNEKLRIRFAVQSATKYFVDSSLKDLLRFETNCAYSVMEFEFGMHQDAISELAQRYLLRDYIPFNPMTAAIIWQVAEKSHAQGDRAAAIALWTLLTSKGGTEIPEVRYAQSRLRVQPTELENLWQN
jgi:hypothetical protein